MNILVVDDQVTVLRFLAEALAQQGHTVTTSTNGRRGLETFRQGYFDLVLTDRNMPVMSGDELAAAVKELSPDTPVIMVTGSDIATSGEDNRPAGVDSILGKPVSLDTLRQALSQVR